MRQRIVITITRPEFWLLGLLLWLLLSAGRSLGTPWARVALTEALRWSAGIGLALSLGLLFRHTRTAARVVVALAGALALLGIAEGLHPGGGGLTGPYQDHQLYGSVLLLLLPPVVAVALTARGGRWRLGGVAAAGAGALCLALSQTRSAWVGALAAALVFGLLWLFRSGSHRREGRTLLLAAAALAGAVLALWLLLTPLDLRAPLTVRARTLSQLSVDKSWQERLTIWEGASRLVASHPLYGIGLGRYPGAQWTWTQVGRPLTPSERPSLSEEAHDLYLQTAAETGLIGLSFYAAALAAFVFQGLSRLRQTHRRHSPGQDALIIASLSLVAGQAVDALASPSWQFGEASLLFWALLGLGLAAMRGPEPEPVAVHVPLTLRRAGRLALSGGVAVTLAANILPLGLLTPVEAYTIPSGYTYSGNTVAPSSATVSLAKGNTVSFTVKCLYKNNSNAADIRSQDVTFEGPVSPTGTYFNVSGGRSLSGDITAFSSTPATRNVLTIDPRNVNRTLTCIAHFSNNGFNQATGSSFVSVVP